MLLLSLICASVVSVVTCTVLVQQAIEAVDKVLACWQDHHRHEVHCRALHDRRRNCRDAKSLLELFPAGDSRSTMAVAMRGRSPGSHRCGRKPELQGWRTAGRGTCRGATGAKDGCCVRKGHPSLRERRQERRHRQTEGRKEENDVVGQNGVTHTLPLIEWVTYYLPIPYPNHTG